MATATAEAVVMPCEPRRLHAFFRGYPVVAGVAAAVLGAIVLLGWIAGIEAITHPSGKLPITVPNSALMALLSGVALALRSGARRGRAARVGSRIAAGAVALLAIATLFEYLSGFDLGIDRMISEAIYEPWPDGRPSPYTAIAYILVAAALLLLDRKTRRGRYISDYFALLAEAFAIASLLGYLFGVPVMYELPSIPYVGMTLFTTLTVLALSIGLLSLHIEDGVIGVVLAPDAGGVVARQLLLGLAVFPPIAIAVIVGARIGWYALPAAAALTLLFALAESSVFILNTARRLSRIDAVQRKLTDELRESEARVRSLVEEAKDGIFLSSREHGFIDVNPAGCAMLGYTRAELIGKRLGDLVSPEELPRVEQERALVLAGKTVRSELVMRRRDGTTFDAEIVASMHADRRWQAIIRDVTARKLHARALAAAFEAEQELRADLETVDSARDAVAEALVSLRGPHIEPVLAQLAEQARRLTHASYAAVAVGRDTGKQFEHWVAAGSAPELEQAIRREPPAAGVQTYAGHHFLTAAIQRASRVIGHIHVAVPTDAGQFTLRDERLVGMLADGAEIAIEIARSYAWLQAILDQLPEGVLVADEHERIYLINRALRGWAANPEVSPDAAFGRPPMFDVCDAKGEPMPLEELPLARALRAGESIQDQEFFLRQPDGVLLPVDARGTPIRDETGRPAGAVVVLRDSSERKELERLRDEWIAVVAHDLRQPVHTIVFAFDLLWEHAAGADRTLLERVRSSAMHLNRMIEDLFSAARISAGRVDVECTYGDIGRIAADAIERIKLSYPDVQIELAAPVEQAVWVDPERIQQVFANLLSNAVKYRTPDTPVRVEIVRTEEGVRVGVLNQGPPIDADERALLFHRFARARTSRGKRGVGLGLYITRGLVEAHGGRIWVDCQGGTTAFYFTLKVPELPPRAAQA